VREGHRSRLLAIGRYRADVASWRDLQADLRRLERESPPVLLSYPSTDPGEPTPRRCSIQLAAYAEDVAADLYARHADLVDLHVGLLPYPGRLQRRGKRRGRPRYFSAAGRAVSTTLGITVELTEPASPPRISSGFADVVPLQITNRSEDDRHLQTNGVLQTYVVDPAHHVIAGYSGFQHMPLVVFTARAGESIQVPALVGTASLVPELGYAVPPGTWGFVVELALGGDLYSSSPRKETVVWSSPLPLEVSARQ
jgi:hypothetical protein